MFKPLSVFIGLRYVKSRQKRGFASFISAASTVGIALGVMVLILVMSAMNGFERELANRLLSIVPHAEFIAVDGGVDNVDELMAIAKQHPQVLAAAPVIKLPAMMSFGSQAKGLEIRAVDHALELNVSSIGDFIVAGQWQDMLSQNGVVLGAGVAKKLGVAVGDSVEVLIPKQDGNGNLTAPVARLLPVVAIFRFGGVIDDGLAYIPLELGAKMAGLIKQGRPQVQGFRIKVADVFNAAQTARQVGASLFGFYAYVHNWTHTQGHLYQDIQLVRMVMFIVLVLVIAVASFNIVSTLIMAINDKKSDIAILLTMGASRATILASFVVQGVFNGVAGCFAGGLLGMVLATNLTQIAKQIEAWLGTQFLEADVYFVDFIPTELHSQDVVVTVSCALILSLVSTIYPAWRATRIEPAKVLGQC